MGYTTVPQLTTLAQKISDLADGKFLIGDSLFGWKDAVISINNLIIGDIVAIDWKTDVSKREFYNSLGVISHIYPVAVKNTGLVAFTQEGYEFVQAVSPDNQLVFMEDAEISVFYSKLSIIGFSQGVQDVTKVTNEYLKGVNFTSEGISIETGKTHNIIACPFVFKEYQKLG